MATISQTTTRLGSLPGSVAVEIQVVAEPRD
jgi:hypothetical protein